MKRQVKRGRAVSLIRVLSGAQFSFGFLLIFFGVYSTNYHTSSIHTTVPYYSGAIIAGIMVLIFSISGGAVFHKAYKAKTELRALTEPRIAMMIYIFLFPFTTCASVAGAVVTSSYGFCVDGSQCSYAVNNNYNRGMAILLFVLEIFCVISCVCSVILIVKYAKLFGVTCAKHGSDVTKVSSGVVLEVSSTQKDVDDFVLEKWERKVVKEVNVSKIKEYRKESRMSENPGNATLVHSGW